jgi:hypothetical protein
MWSQSSIPMEITKEPAQSTRTYVVQEHESYFAKVFEPIAISTYVLAIITWCLARYTYRLFTSTKQLATDTREASAKALNASTKATEVLIDMERPYLAGGGDFEDKTGKELYRLDIENHGKTPGFVVAYGLEFAKLDELKREFPSARDVQRRPYIESLSPQGARKQIPLQIEKECGMDIVFGCVWYEDIWGGKYSSRFILRIAATRDVPGHGLTRLSGIEGVSSDYWKWEYPNKERT